MHPLLHSILEVSCSICPSVRPSGCQSEFQVKMSLFFSLHIYIYSGFFVLELHWIMFHYHFPLCPLRNNVISVVFSGNVYTLLTTPTKLAFIIKDRQTAGRTEPRNFWECLKTLQREMRIAFPSHNE